MSASSWFYYKKFITMYGHMNVKQIVIVFNLCSCHCCYSMRHLTDVDC